MKMSKRIPTILIALIMLAMTVYSVNAINPEKIFVHYNMENYNDLKNTYNASNSGTSITSNASCFGGNLGSCAYFDGASYISLSSLISEFNNHQQGAISLWFSVYEYSTSPYIYSFKKDVDNRQRVAIRSGGTNIDVGQKYAGGWYPDGNTGLSVSKDTWYLLGVEFNTTHFNIYINGTLKNTYLKDEVYNCKISWINGSCSIIEEFHGIQPLDNAIIGSYDGSVAHFTGYMDEITIWNESLNSSEWTELYNSGAGINMTNIVYPSEEPPECINNSDCGLCQKCSAGSCINQTNIEDTKDECTAQYTGCTNDYTLQGDNGQCNGAGNCTIGTLYSNISEGNVCMNAYDTNPNATKYCNEQYQCITGQAIAIGYYTGYIGNGSAICVETDWQTSGNNWTATTNYTINVTENSTTCQETPIPCVSNWTCDAYGICNSSNILPCTEMADLNMCGTNFTGNITNYDTNCTYIPTPEATVSNDITGAVIDNGVKMIKGFGTFAVLFGIIIAGIGVSYGIKKLITKK